MPHGHYSHVAGHKTGTGNRMIRGIDVSHYQRSVDWAGLTADHNLAFGAAKCGEGTSFVDSYFPTNWKRMKAAGLHRIAYWYATPSASSARTQAAKLVALSDPQPGDALCLDLEKSSLSQTATNAWMRAFGDALRDLIPGVTTIAYLGGYAANGSGRSAVDHFDHWWYPRYASMGPAKSWPSSFNPNVAKPNTTGFVAPRCPSIWQWSPNVGGMDANVSALTVDQLFTSGGTDMPTADEVAAAIFGTKLTNAIDGTSTARFDTFIEQTHKQASFAARDAAAALALLQAPEALAAAIVAELPKTPGGGPTAPEIADAVAAKFSTLLGGTA